MKCSVFHSLSIPLQWYQLAFSMEIVFPFSRENMGKVVSIMEIGFTGIKKYVLLYTSVQYHEEIRCWEIMNIKITVC